jgi:hypothetical protein
MYNVKPGDTVLYQFIDKKTRESKVRPAIVIDVGPTMIDVYALLKPADDDASHSAGPQYRANVPARGAQRGGESCWFPRQIPAADHAPAPSAPSPPPRRHYADHGAGGVLGGGFAHFSDEELDDEEDEL